MKNFLLRISIIFLIILLQVSFLNLIFADNRLVNLSILAVISWIIVSGFEKMWVWIILLGFLNDIFLAQKIGPNILFFILFSYLISFVSRRFIIERRFSGFLLVVVFILMGNVWGSFFDFLFSGAEISKEVVPYLKNYFINWGDFIATNIYAGICFYFLYSLINKVEKYIAINENRLKMPF
jgi:cell shape-determining protein MreD